MADPNLKLLPISKDIVSTIDKSNIDTWTKYLLPHPALFWKFWDSSEEFKYPFVSLSTIYNEEGLIKPELLVAKEDINYEDAIKHIELVCVPNAWILHDEISIHAVKTGLKKSGLKSKTCVVFLATVNVEGPFLGQQFVFAGNTSFKQAGIERRAIAKHANNIHNARAVYGCKWEIIPKEKYHDFHPGFPAGFIEFINTYKPRVTCTIKHVIGEVINGPYKNTRFYLSGIEDMAKYKFTPSKVIQSYKTAGIYLGCKFKLINKDDYEILPNPPNMELINFLRSNHNMINPVVKPILATVKTGDYVNRRFVLFGNSDIAINKLSSSSIRFACKNKTRYNGCTWEYISNSDALLYQRGLGDIVL